MSNMIKTPAGQALLQHAEEMKKTTLPEILQADPKRLENCAIALNGLRFNYGLNRVTPKTIELLVKLAQEQKLESWRDKMFAGEKINVTENRAVLHTALRAKTGSILVDGKDILPEVKETHGRMRQFVEAVHNGQRTSATGKSFKHVVNIGIGGSDLGPRLAVQALSAHAKGPRVHFVANVDAFDLMSVIGKLDPAETLFVVVSKTFTTQETLLNAQTAREWVTSKLGKDSAARHFVAVSSNIPAVEAFGIARENVFPMWDWVGGRFSLWSAVGLSIALALGMDGFEKMLDGAAAMDTHFRQAPLAQNMPVLLALFGIWHRDFCAAHAIAVLPYSERLRELPRYLQQLEMESNGKSVTRNGQPVDTVTAPVIFGDCGTVSQHSFHQWLHQGTDSIPADFIAIIDDDLSQPKHHQALLTNMVAQATAFAFGRTDAANAHEIYPGNRSSNLFLLDRLDPTTFGMLIALYEHKVFTQGILWNVNSFDQPGVELGKKLAQGLQAQSAATPAGAFAAKLMDFIKK